MLLPKINKFRQLSWAERWLLLEATGWLAVARLGLLLVPFRHIAPRLGQTIQESTSTLAPDICQKAERIGWAVRAMARRTPWESACLAQAISAKAMLRRRHIHSTLYLGLAKDKAQKMQAHAWLRCGDEIITGKAGHERFSIISFFAEASTNSHAMSAPEMAAASDAEGIQELLLMALNPTVQLTTGGRLKQLDAVGWEALVQAAKKQHVLTLFLARLQQLDVETAVPPHLLSQMQQMQQQITLQNMAIYRELHLIQQPMQAQNIPMIVLKGAHLATAVYPHIGQRAMGDLDLLVPEDKLDETVQILHGLGWQETRPLAIAASLKEHYHLPSFAKKGVLFLLEPHWNIVHPQKAYKITPDQFWHQVQACDIAGTQVLVFKPHLQLLHLALHAAYNHQFAFDLRSLCDIAALISVHGEALDWNTVAVDAKAWGWQRGVYLTLLLVNQFWQTAVPPAVLTELKPAHMPESIVDFAKQQLLQGRANNQKVSINFAKLKQEQPTWAKLKFALSFLLPSRRRLSWRYGVSEHSAKIWLYYFINFRDMISRNAKRFWQLQRGANQVVEAAERRNQLSEWLT